LSQEGEIAPHGGVLAGAAVFMALAGGLVLLAISFLTVVSGGLRWLTSQPIRGDFELISIGSGLGVLAALGFTTLKRGNIMVDSFSTWLPRRWNEVVDGFWQLVWAAVRGVIAWRMALGGAEAMANGSRTIGLLALPFGWAIAVGAACFGLTALIALAWVPRLLRGR
jgi:TRAP-type C4-dicarboxylate transport system permease small subunit